MLPIDVITPIQVTDDHRSTMKSIKTSEFSSDGVVSQHLIFSDRAYSGNHDGLVRSETEESTSSAFKRMFEESSAEAIHLLMPGVLVMPGFYKAMSAMIDYSKCDFAFCHFLFYDDTTVKLFDSPSIKGTFNISQTVVRRWVIEETGIPESLEELYEKVIAEYRGVEVPAILCGGESHS